MDDEDVLLIFLIILACLILYHVLIISCLRCCTCLKTRQVEYPVTFPRYGDQMYDTNDPNEKHKKAPSIIFPLRCSHRGGGFEAPENTLEAFKNSLNLGIKYLECDVHLTLDATVVIFHDFDTSRVCDLSSRDQANSDGANPTPNQHKKQYIGEFNYSELPYLRKSFNTGLIGEKKFENENENENESVKICTLEELFQLCNSEDFDNDSIVNIDLKNVPDQLKECLNYTQEQVDEIFRQKIQKVYSLIVQYNMLNRVYWVSMNETFQQLMRDDPQYSQISRCFSTKESIKVILLWFFGFLPFFPLKDQNWNMLMITEELYRQQLKMLSDSGQSSCIKTLGFYLLKTMFQNKHSLLRHLKSRGCVVTLWVVNTRSEFDYIYERFCKSGCQICCCKCRCCCPTFEPLVDGIMTDCPSILANWIKDKEQQSIGVPNQHVDDIIQEEVVRNLHAAAIKEIDADDTYGRSSRFLN